MGDCCENVIKSEHCPVCSTLGQEVKYETVKSLVLSSEIKNENYSLCLNSECDVAYFSKEILIYKDELKVPIWYKKDAKPKYICYCAKVTEEEIISAIKNNNSSIKDIVKVTGAMTISDCLHNHPTGKCCSSHIKDLVKIYDFNNKY